MVVITRGVCPGLIIPHSHVDPVEPNSESFDGSLTEDADVLCSYFSHREIQLQWRQLCLHNLWPHRVAHAGGGASRSEMKLSNSQAEHIGEVHQLLLRFMRKVCLEAIVNPLSRGPGLVQGRLKNGVHIGQPLHFTSQWERER